MSLTITPNISPNTDAVLKTVTSTQGFWKNTNTLSESYTVPTGENAMTAGPITINAGVIITVSDGSVWTVI